MTTLPDDVDPFIGERIIAIRNRFGITGLRQAADMIATELAIFGGDAGESLDDDGRSRS